MTRRYRTSEGGAGEYIHQLISEAGLTQADLSRISGLRQPHLSRLIHGEVKLSVRTAARIADALEIDPNGEKYAKLLGFAVIPGRPWVAEPERNVRVIAEQARALNTALITALRDPGLEQDRLTESAVNAISKENELLKQLIKRHKQQ